MCLPRITIITMDAKSPPPTNARAPPSKKPGNRNPFYGGARDNFPSLERALGSLLDNQHASSDNCSLSGSRTESLDLSIDARAALHEHLRHIAKFGMDNEFAEQSHAPTADTSSSLPPAAALPNNTLDEEWENILQGNPLDFHYPLNDSTLPTFDRLQVLDATTAENDIEVAVTEMTFISVTGEDDYFNSSKVWQLMTPEKNRGRRPQAVTNRDEEDSYNDEDEGEDNTPESACMVETARPDPMGQDKVSPLYSSNESEPSPRPSPSASPMTSQSPLEALSPLAAAAVAMAQDLERNPSRMASVALADFLDDASGVHNSLLDSLLVTSVHEDLPLITSPFAPAPDMEGSFADWSVQSVENHSFVMPSSMTPIRPLPPLSPIRSIRGSPSSSQRGSGSHRSRGSPRSSTSSSSFGKGSWRLSMHASSPQRTDFDFGLRDEMVSPIRPLKLAPTQEEASEQESSPVGSASPLSPLAKQAAQTAARFLQARQKPSLQPPNKWPSLGSADPFESSSTAGMADCKFHQNIHRAAMTKMAPNDPHKDAMTAPLVSLDTMSSTDHSGIRSHRSADHALIDRRRYRSVVPRRILFPDDYANNEQHGDSFDRPCNSF